MKIKILSDTIVRFPAGSVIDVAGDEGKRLIALGNAAEVKEKPKKKEK